MIRGSGIGSRTMPEMRLRSGFGAHDGSPDSVIFTAESNLSRFSSASASVERCSFASDGQDRDSLSSEISTQLAGHDFEQKESSSCPDLGPNLHKLTLGYKQSCPHWKKAADKAKAVLEEDKCGNLEYDDIQHLDSARNSFSVALKECQERRSRAESLSRKLDKRRPASLDLNNGNASSPRLGTMKKSLALSRMPCTFPSPGTPNYGHAAAGMQKGWSSERVPLHNNASRKHLSSAVVPFNNGRALPSKWEDAERWIFSPVAADDVAKSSVPPYQRRPKSKSGPLGPPGTAYCALYSPAMPVFGGNTTSFTASSAGLLAADAERVAILSCNHGGALFTKTEPCIGRSVSLHGCPQVLSQMSLTGSQGEFLDRARDAPTNISRAVSRRDMATQMSPEGSPHSSSEIRPSNSAPSPVLPIIAMQREPSFKLDVRDVQVDERVTMTRWSNKHKSRATGKIYVDGWRKKDKDTDSQSYSWDISDVAKNMSKVKREEAKIIAWENLQKAKAEEAIRQLEMKLEKKRSSSMEKIMNKLRSAQKKAQETRNSLLAKQSDQVAKAPKKAMSFHGTRQMSSLSGCFTCHAF